jgi:hypothetical protein
MLMLDIKMDDGIANTGRLVGYGEECDYKTSENNDRQKSCVLYYGILYNSSDWANSGAEGDNAKYSCDKADLEDREGIVWNKVGLAVGSYSQECDGGYLGSVLARCGDKNGVWVSEGECIIVSGSQTFNYTGAPQEFTVPKEVKEVKLAVWGAQGGGTKGGKGGYSYGALSVSPEQVLYIYVGGAGKQPTGGWNGGGDGGPNAYGGGGGTDVRTTANSDYQDRIIVAGGGGGSEGSNKSSGGTGGGNSGGNGVGSWKGGGGTQTAGGYEGDARDLTYTSTDGSFGIGGVGGWKPNIYHGGGGGGGYYGGGGGDWTTLPGNVSSGGGGSGYIGGVTNSSSVNGEGEGDGKAIICWGDNSDCF